MACLKPKGQLYRVWIARTEDWQPRHWTEIPPAAWALRPAEEGVMSAVQASCYLSGFNGQLLGNPKNVWAIAVPVRVSYQGDMEPGQRFAKKGTLEAG